MFLFRLLHYRFCPRRYGDVPQGRRCPGPEGLSGHGLNCFERRKDNVHGDIPPGGCNMTLVDTERSRPSPPVVDGHRRGFVSRGGQARCGVN